MKALVDRRDSLPPSRDIREAEPGALYVKDDEAFRLAKQLAVALDVIKAAAVKLALRNELATDRSGALLHDEETIGGLDPVPIGLDETAEAVRAHARYAKGIDRPAQFNMGDRFAYAGARTNDARLLYRSDDFAHTDMAWQEPA